MFNEKVLIARSNGCAIWGRVLNAQGKLGQFEVIHDFHGLKGTYHKYSDAEKIYKASSAKKSQSSEEFSDN